jgi:hypothetical protein
VKNALLDELVQIAGVEKLPPPGRYVTAADQRLPGHVLTRPTGCAVLRQIAGDRRRFWYLEIRSHGATRQHHGNKHHAITAAQPVM